MTDPTLRERIEAVRSAIALTTDPARLLMGQNALNLDFDRLSPVIAHTSGKARRTYYRQLAQEQVK